MNLLKKLAKALLFPHIAVLLILLPLSAALAIYSVNMTGSESLASCLCYALSAYTLTVWCVRIPGIARAASAFKRENRYARRWFEDARARMTVSLYASLLWNAAYAAFQLCLGIYHSSSWYYALSAYYIFLAVMRFFLAHHTRKFVPGKKMRAELIRYRACGWAFLAVNLALTFMVIFMTYENKYFEHHEITTIALAAYTFTTFTVAIVHSVKYRRYKSPVFSASAMISLAAACVSMLTLTSTMLSTFGESSELYTVFRRQIIGAVGGAVSLFVLSCAIFMIVQATKKLRLLENDENAQEDRQIEQIDAS